jgi:hypothetical protein
VTTAQLQEEIVEDDEPKTELRTALESAIQKVESTPENTESNAPEQPEKAPKEPKEPKEPEAKAPEAKDPKEAKEPKEATEEHAAGDRAPAAWKAPLKAKWGTVDPEVKAEIHRREREIAKAMQTSAPAREIAQTFTNTLRPYMPRLQAAGAQPMQAIKSLLDVDHVLSSAPMGTRAKMMAKLISDYGIDVAALDEALSGGNPEETNPASILDQRIQQALKPLQETVQTLTARERAQMAAENNALQSQVDGMRSNTEKFPYFEDVQDEMADLIELKARRGIYLSIEDAYNQAVRTNPEAQAAETQAIQQRKAQNLNSAAQKALGASLSISGAPAPSRTDVDASDLRATIEAAFASHGGR